MLNPDANIYICPKCRLVSTDTRDIARRHCAFCDLFAEESRAEPVSALRDGFFETGALSRRDCFSVAAQTLLQHALHRDARLVHGWVRKARKIRNSIKARSIGYVEHAWVETPGTETSTDAAGARIVIPAVIVVDYCQVDPRARFMLRGAYYDYAGVRMPPPPKRYTRELTILLGLLHRNAGPWSEPGNTRQ
jgi:hypothetical protein